MVVVAVLRGEEESGTSRTGPYSCVSASKKERFDLPGSIGDHERSPAFVVGAVGVCAVYEEEFHDSFEAAFNGIMKGIPAVSRPDIRVGTSPEELRNEGNRIDSSGPDERSSVHGVSDIKVDFAPVDHAEECHFGVLLLWQVQRLIVLVDGEG